MYDSKTYKVDEDLEVLKIIDKSELSPYSIATYYSVIKQFCNSIGKSYYDIVKEVKELQRDKIVNGTEIIRYNPNDSLINDYIRIFMNYLTEKNNKKSTINLRLKQLMSLLKKNNIETPKVNFKNEQTQSKVQLITTDDIRFILKNSNIHHQALITFMASTGIRRYDVINFKIEDFIESCSDFTNALFLDDFLEEAPKNMIPYFEFIPNKTKKTGLPCKVCCSAEASNLILQSLKMRQKSIEKHNRNYHDNLELNEECPLFASRKQNYIGNYNIQSITLMFHTKNKLLKQHKEKILDNQLKNHEISKKEWKLKKESIPKFHPHGLRHRFISTVRAYTTNRDISLLLEGHASSINTDKFYIGESEELFNKQSIKETYLQVMPHLTFFQEVDPVNYFKNKQETDKLHKEINSLKKKINEYDRIEAYLEKHSVLNNLNGGV